VKTITIDLTVVIDIEDEVAADIRADSEAARAHLEVDLQQRLAARNVFLISVLDVQP
jgi:hypothetical protein